MLAEPLVAPLLYLIFGNVISVFLNSHFGTPTWLWAPFAALAGIGSLGARLPRRPDLDGGGRDHGRVRDRGLPRPRDHADLRGRLEQHAQRVQPQHRERARLGSVFAGMVYTVLAFIGFEASLPLAEETEIRGARSRARSCCLAC